MNRAILVLVFVTMMLNLYLIFSFLLRRRMQMSQRLDLIGTNGEDQADEFELDRSTLLGKDLKAGKYKSDFLNQMFAKQRRLLAQADVLMKPEEFFLMRLATATIIFLLVVLISRILFMALVGGIIGYIIPGVFLNSKIEKRAAIINKQLPEALDLIASGLRAGLSFAQAMNMMAKDMEQPIRGEFDKVLRDNTLGKSMEVALQAMVDRTKDEDIDLFVTAMIVQRQVGGNLTEILEIISNTLRERVRIKGDIKTMTAQSRMSAIVIGLLPPGIAVVLSVMNPEYIRPLFSTTAGLILIGLASLMTISGALIMMRMSKVEV